LRITAAALLGLVLAGCAPATQLTAPRVASSPPHSSTDEVVEAIDDDADIDDSLSSDDALSEFLAETGAAMLANDASEDPPDPSDGADESPTAIPQEIASFEPEVVHRAKIDMAREALVEENLNKERVDLAEELQRELAALQASQASKSRAHRGGHTKKQP
jgi:hypothetical protein